MNCLRPPSFVVLAFGLLWLDPSAIADPPHRLDSLSAEEIARTVEILRGEGKAGDRSRYVQIALNEPPKESSWETSRRPPREALAILIDRPGGSTFEAVVDLDAGKVRSSTRVGRGKPPLLAGDFATTARVVRADRRFLEAIRRRGITDPQEVQVDAWAPGPDVPADRRIARALFFLKSKDQAAYLRPIGNLTASVDLDKGQVIEVTDLGILPVPPADGGLEAGRARSAPAPPRIGPRPGVGFALVGQEFRWDDWRLRFSMHPRDGLILREVALQDGGRLRPILYRGSISELLVPYGDPARDWSFRNAFDEGEYGLGRFADSLEPGVDCPENATFADAVLADETGSAYTIPRAIGIFERDAGLLWKHSARGRPEARRGRELVVYSSSTLGNYVYGFEWSFRQDGSIGVNVILTGIMLAKNVDPARNATVRPTDPTGHRVSKGVVAAHHQHFFNFRLDLDIEGAEANRVSELNAEAVAPGDDNPQGNAFLVKEEDLPSEGKAGRMMSLATGRRWKVYNRKVTTSTGHPAGYRLVPGENAIPLAATSASVRRRAGFLDAHFWATRFEPAQLHASGPFPNQNGEDGGLGAWAKADRSLDGQDVVVWYTMGVNHDPRPEEWPVMPAHHAGFRLIPDGFFERNPTLDLPEPPR